MQNKYFETLSNPILLKEIIETDTKLKLLSSEVQKDDKLGNSEIIKATTKDRESGLISTMYFDEYALIKQVKPDQTSYQNMGEMFDENQTAFKIQKNLICGLIECHGESYAKDSRKYFKSLADLCREEKICHKMAYKNFETDTKISDTKRGRHMREEKELELAYTQYQDIMWYFIEYSKQIQNQLNNEKK